MYSQKTMKAFEFTKRNYCKDKPVNNHELLNILVFGNTGCTQYPVVSCKYWVVPLISTRVSGYSQVILFDWMKYRKTSNISGTLVGNTIVDHSDVVGATPSNYIFILNLTSGFTGFGNDNRKTVRESLKCWDLVRLILETWQQWFFRENL